MTEEEMVDSHPEYHVGYTIAGDLGSPKVLYAM